MSETSCVGVEESLTGQIHRDLFAAIPSFRCPEGCVACCGPVPFSAWEWSRLTSAERLRGRRIKDPLTCPFIESGRCSIYDRRPLMCRIFGTTPDLLCPRGHRPVTLLDSRDARQIVSRYVDEIEALGESGPRRHLARSAPVSCRFSLDKT